MGKEKRPALYLRVSTGEQTVDNQRSELEAAAAARGWPVVAGYADEGISGAKGREGRPQLDLMLKDAVRRRFDVAMVWAVDRLGRGDQPSRAFPVHYVSSSWGSPLSATRGARQAGDLLRSRPALAAPEAHQGAINENFALGAARV